MFYALLSKNMEIGHLYIRPMEIQNDGLCNVLLQTFLPAMGLSNISDLGSGRSNFFKWIGPMYFSQMMN